MVRVRRWWAVLLAAVLTATLCAVTASATVYHVSPEGTNTPPYDTYESAANSPRDALAAVTGPGDTVLIHAGQYDIDTAIVVPSGVSLIGIDRDSVELTWCCYQDYSPKIMFDLQGDHHISGITFGNFTVAASQDVSAIFMQVVPGDVFVHDCEFRQVWSFGSVWDTLEFHDCIFETGSRFGIHTTTGFGTVLIHDNYFTGGASAFSPNCVQAWGETITIEDNIFDLSESNFRGASVDVQEGSRPVVVRNNLMMGGDLAISWSPHDGLIENNTIIQTDPSQSSSILVLLGKSDTLTIRNNIIIDSPVPRFYDCTDCPPNTPLNYSFNAFWPPVASFYSLVNTGAGLSIKDTGNANQYPMFGDDSLYHLQAGSPLIDAGDPSVLDADGSRSDIGWTGGPHGIIPTYPELPPQPPDSASATGTDGIVSLCWSSRPEADLAGYNLYRGDASSFWTEGLTPYRVLAPGDTCATDTILAAGESVYYVVTAFDSAGLESAASPEVSYTVTGILDGPEGDLLPRSASILRAYPNPFNDATVIEFAVPVSAGALHIDVFNVLGQRVERISLGRREAGVQSVAWAAAVPSGVYFARLVSGGVSLGRTVKLVVLR